jgi:hypothetical protein
MGATLHSRTRLRAQGPVFIDGRVGRTAPQISVRFDLATMESLRAIATAEKRPVAFIIRRLIGHALAPAAKEA